MIRDLAFRCVRCGSTCTKDARGRIVSYCAGDSKPDSQPDRDPFDTKGTP